MLFQPAAHMPDQRFLMHGILREVRVTQSDNGRVSSLSTTPSVRMVSSLGLQLQPFVAVVDQMHTVQITADVAHQFRAVSLDSIR